MSVVLNNSYILDYHISADFEIRLLGWNMIPFFISSPQFLSLAISKSNLLLAVNCACISICVAAAFLHNAWSSLSMGVLHVIENPTPRL